MLENVLSREIEGLEGHVKKYRETAEHLKLLPATAKRANGIDYDMRLNLDATSPEEMQPLDLKGFIKSALIELRESSGAKTREAQKERLSLQEQLADVEELLARKKEEYVTHEETLAKLDAQYKMEKLRVDDEVNDIVKEADQTEQKVQGIRSQVYFPLM